MEVAIFDPQDEWWAYDEENCKLFLSEKPYVNGHLDADNVAKVIALVAPLELDREAEA